MEVSELTSKCCKRSNSTPHMLNDGMYDLTTNARQAIVGRNKLLDKGAGRQLWECLDLLNCAASVTF